MTTIVRQEGDHQKRFREILLRLRSGIAQTDYYDILSTRINNHFTDSENDTFKDALYLLHSNMEVSLYNLKKLSELAKKGEYICRINAIHSDPRAKNVDPENMFGLEKELLLARGARVMLTSNEWTDIGLTNGATGTVRHIIYNPDDRPPSMPVAIVLEMDRWYNGPHLTNKPRHVVITPKTASTSVDGNKNLERTQFPLKLAFAITIHKSQGRIVLIHLFEFTNIYHVKE